MRHFAWVVILLFTNSSWAQLPDELLCGEKSRIVHRLMDRGNSKAHHGYNINYHRCHWTANPKVGPYLQGKVLFKFTVTQNCDSLGVDFSSGMQLNHIWYHGAEASFVRKGDVIFISKFGGWVTGSIDSFEIEYEGNPVNTGGFGSYIYDNHKTGPVIHTLSEPYGAIYWWPCKQSLVDKIDSIDIYVHTAKDLKAGSNGLLVETLNQGDSFNIYHWKHRYPVATYLVAMAITNYDEFTHYAHFHNRPDSMPVLNYVFPQFSAKAKTETVSVLPMIRLYDSLFVDYPFAKEKYGHAQFTWGGGMEHQTMSFMVNFGWDLMAHELAHQWFGDLVTCGTWQDLWLNEGFATYLNALCYEFIKSPEEFKDRLRGMRNDVTSDPNGAVCPSDTSQVNILFNGRLTYNKGAWVLHQLRRKIGDKAFFQACRRYLTEANRYGFGYTTQLQKYMEQESGQNLSVYFQQWFFGEGFPIYKVNWKQVGETVKVVYTQTPSNVTVPFWYGTLPIQFKGKNNSYVHTFIPSKLTDSVTLNLPFDVDTAIFDPEVSVLAKVAVGGMNINKVQAEPLVLFPNPGDNQITVLSRNPDIIRVDMYSDVGQLIASFDHQDSPQSMVVVNSQRLTSGTYFFRIYTENLVYSRKWLKL